MILPRPRFAAVDGAMLDAESTVGLLGRLLGAVAGPESDGEKDVRICTRRSASRQSSSVYSLKGSCIH